MFFENIINERDRFLKENKVEKEDRESLIGFIEKVIKHFELRCRIDSLDREKSLRLAKHRGAEVNLIESLLESMLGERVEVKTLLRVIDFKEDLK